MSTDGDSGYNPLYEKIFNLIYTYFKKNGFDGFANFINVNKNNYLLKKKCMIIGDMIHFIKNRRTQIAISHIIFQGVEISVECLKDILEGSAAINDKSELSKLQDTFPVEIFNFQILAQVLARGNMDLVYFMFPICCWNEAYNNKIIGKNTRLYLLECALFGFKRFYEIQIKNNSKTEIMPQMAIKRAFVSIAIVWKEFKESSGVFNFAFYGTMLQEHYHSLVRGMAKGVDTLERTVSCIAKSNIILDIQNKEGINLIKGKRYSVGGTHFNPEIHKTEFIQNFDYEPYFVINRLENLTIYGKQKIFSDIFIDLFRSFIDSIGKGSLRISCQKQFHYGRKIMSREITNSKEEKIAKALNENDFEDNDDINFRKEIQAFEKVLNDEDIGIDGEEEEEEEMGNYVEEEEEEEEEEKNENI